MRVADFDFALPKDLIADRPVEPRDAARLLHITAGCLVDASLADLPRLLRRGDLLVVNDTRVLPVRLAGRRGAARIETTLHRRLGEARWRAFVKGARRLRVGDRIVFADDFAAGVSALGEGGEVELVFDCAGGAFANRLEAHGSMPLPPYIKRPPGGDPRDRRDYQTMFAARDGAVAAPTAGLHFTPGLMARLGAAGIATTTVTLHVGAGTFLPVKVEDTRHHRMHPEWGEISAEAAARINAARRAGGRIVAVGTTALRLVESASGPDGVAPFAAETDLFITPGYRFKAIDVLFTNFHLPRSTLFMLVSAFAGLARMHEAYAHAIAEGYRFFSYGDACLIERSAA